MGQKCNPTGLRIGVIKNWDSRWYAKKGEFGDTLVEDYKLRNYLLESLHGAGVPKVEIERDAKRVRINIHCAKPGMVIGKQGAEIEKLKAVCAKKLGKDANEVFINIVEIKQPDLNATLVAQSVAQQLERRVSFRRAVKGAIRNTMRLGARGIKIMVSGRIGGAEIARYEEYREGVLSLHTLRQPIDYAYTPCHTTYGVIGVKVWIALPDNYEELRNRRPDEGGKFGNRGRFNRRPNNGNRAARPAVTPSANKDDADKKGE